MSDTSIAAGSSQPAHSQLLSAVRLVLIVLLVAISILAILTLPDSFSATQSDWQFSEAVGSAGTLLPYDMLVAIVTGLELVMLGLYLATAVLMLVQPPQVTTLVAALAMMTLPFMFGMGGLGDPGIFAGPFQGLLAGLTGAFEVGGIIALIVLAIIFPNGRAEPRWLIGLPVLTLLIGTVVTVAPNLDERFWFVFAFALAGTILAATVSQVARYRKADPIQRDQSIWFLVALITLLGWIVISSIGITSPMLLLISFVPIALLPVGLIAAAWRGAWGPVAPGRQRTTFLAAVGLFTLAAIAGSAVWLQQNQLQAVDVASLATGAPLPLVLDVDMAMDDITALLVVLQHPAADLRAITVNGVAFAHCDGGVRGALGILELAKAPDIPVACGRETAYSGGIPAPEAWRASADNLYGAAVSTGDRSEDPRSAAELLTDVVRSAPGEITVLAVGPLTNLADAFAADPELPQLIKQVVIMGGAVDVPGNVANEEEGIDNQFAEWNFLADPVAADLVIESGVPILLIPLDATNDVPFSRGFHQKLSAEHLTKLATFTYNLFYLNPYWLDGGMYWWDTMAVAAGLDNSLVTLEDATLDVITEAGPEFGRSIRTPEGTPVQLATAADKQRFEALLLALLNYQR